MKGKITIVDYDMGNLRSLANALRHLECEVVFAENGAQLADAGHVILPGVGAFGASMKNLVERGLDGALHAHAAAGRPLLGICLGYQVLFAIGSENGETPGLGLFAGRVDRFETDLHVPHVGWNILRPERPHPLLDGLPADPHMYFVHSFRTGTVDTPDDIIGLSDYDGDFVCAVARGSVAGMQFHPERSGTDGLRILNNFIAWNP